MELVSTPGGAADATSANQRDRRCHWWSYTNDG